MSYELNGSTQYMHGNLPSAFGVSSSWCISCWANADVLGATTFQTLFARISSAKAGYGVDVVSFGSTDGVASITTGLNLCATTVTSGSYAVANSSVTLSTGTWFHCYAYFRGTNHRAAYVNGTSGSDNTNISVTPSTYSIGARKRSSVDWYLDGHLADIAIWEGQLDEEQVQALADGGRPWEVARFPLSGTGNELKVYWPFVGSARQWTALPAALPTLVNAPVPSAHPPLSWPSPIAPRPRKRVVLVDGVPI